MSQEELISVSDPKSSSEKKRTIIVGDVHGCLAEFKALLQKVEYNPDTDELILIGDLVGKGPDSVGVVQLCMELGAKAVKGNWDHHIINKPEILALEHTSAERPGPPPSLSPEQLAWLSSLPYFIRLPQHNAVVVHAGFVPGVPFEQQQPQDMMKMRAIRLKDGTATSDDEEDDIVPWAKAWKGPELVIFGHDAKKGLQQEEFAIGLDTGCVYGEKLTAIILPSKEIVQVQAAQRYTPKKKKPRQPAEQAAQQRKAGLVINPVYIKAAAMLAGFLAAPLLVSWVRRRLPVFWKGLQAIRVK